GSKLMLGSARLAQARAALARGKYDAALAAYQLAQQLFGAAGHRAGIARCLLGMGTAHIFLGDWVRAEALYRESLDTYRAIGDIAGQALALPNVMIGAIGRDLAEAQRLADESI